MWCSVWYAVFKALENFADFREIHINPPYTDNTNVMNIYIGFAETNDSQDIVFEVAIVKWNDHIQLVSRAM